MTGATMQWAKRLTGASILLLLIGLVSYYNAMPSMFEQLDPAQNHMLELESGESGELEILALGEYVALRLDGEGEVDLRLVDSTGQEDEGSAPTTFDIVRTGEDGLSYVPVRVFRSTPAGEYTLYNDGTTTLWFVDDVSAQAELFTKPWFVVMMVGCCLGPILGVVGLILALIGWGNRDKDNSPIVFSNDGRLPTTDELYKQHHGLDMETNAEIPDPFASVERSDMNQELQNDSRKEDPESDWKGWDEG